MGRPGRPAYSAAGLVRAPAANSAAAASTTCRSSAGSPSMLTTGTWPRLPTAAASCRSMPVCSSRPALSAAARTAADRCPPAGAAVSSLAPSSSALSMSAIACGPLTSVPRLPDSSRRLGWPKRNCAILSITMLSWPGQVPAGAASAAERSASSARASVGLVHPAQTRPASSPIPCPAAAAAWTPSSSSRSSTARILLSSRCGRSALLGWLASSSATGAPELRSSASVSSMAAMPGPVVSVPAESPGSRPAASPASSASRSWPAATKAILTGRPGADPGACAAPLARCAVLARCTARSCIWPSDSHGATCAILDSTAAASARSAAWIR